MVLIFAGQRGIFRLFYLVITVYYLDTSVRNTVRDIAVS